MTRRRSPESEQGRPVKRPRCSDNERPGRRGLSESPAYEHGSPGRGRRRRRGGGGGGGADHQPAVPQASGGSGLAHVTGGEVGRAAVAEARAQVLEVEVRRIRRLLPASVGAHQRSPRLIILDLNGLLVFRRCVSGVHCVTSLLVEGAIRTVNAGRANDVFDLTVGAWPTTNARTDPRSGPHAAGMLWLVDSKSGYGSPIPAFLSACT